MLGSRPIIMQSATSPSLVVVAPVFNEEELVAEFLDRLARAAPSIGLAGVVLVDDGSTDQTVTRIEQAALTFPVALNVVRLSRNFGHQTAVVAGCEAACALAEKLGADWVGVIDADLQDRPEDFAALLAHHATHDVVYAVRGQRLDGAVMRACAPVFYRLLSKWSHIPIPENAGTFSVMRLPLCRIIVENSDAEPYFPGLRAWVGFRQKGVTLTRQPRARGESKVALRGLIRLSLRAFMLYSDLPLHMFFLLGLFLMALMGAAGLVVVGLRLAHLIDPSGFTTLFIVQIASLGLVIFFMGVLAFMVNRVKHNSSRQRAWVVMENRVMGAKNGKKP